MQCTYCGQPLAPPGAFCGSCGQAQSASPPSVPALPNRLYYDGPAHSRVERDLASIVESIVEQPTAGHHVWMDGFDDWKAWTVLPQLVLAVERAQAKQAEDPVKVARYEKTVEELLGDGNHDEWKLLELAELRSHLSVTLDTHQQIVARLAAARNTDLRVQVDQASMKAFRANQFCVIQLKIANVGQKGMQSVHVGVATSSTMGLVEQDSPFIPPGSDERLTLRLKPETAGQHEFRALFTTRSFTGQESFYRTRPMVFAVARAHESGGAQVYNMDLSAMQVGKIGTLSAPSGDSAGLGLDADWVSVQLTAIGETSAHAWRAKHGGRPKGPPAPSAPPAPAALPDLFHAGPNGTSDSALPIQTVVQRILAAPTEVHNVWHDGLSAWTLWTDVPALATQVRAAQRVAEEAHRSRRQQAKREALLAVEAEAQRDALAQMRAERAREMAQIREENQRERHKAEQAERAREHAERQATQARDEAERARTHAMVDATAHSDVGVMVRLLGYGTKKIPVIKAVRTLTGLGLKDAKALVESTPATLKEWTDPGERQLAEQAADRLRAAGAQVELVDLEASAPTAAGPSKGLHRLRLLDYGAKKISVIKVVRAITGLGLKDAKALVESAPSLITEWDPSVDRQQAEDGAQSLRDAGASVDVSMGPNGPILRLLDFGSKKIAAIKAVRAITRLGLKDAKILVESAPTLVKKWPSSDRQRELEDAATRLRDAGAQVELDA